MTRSLRHPAERLALLCTFVGAAARYWATVFPRVLSQARHLRRSAAQLPDPDARRLALAALAKRSNLEGAAAFAAFVPRRRRATALRALVAFQAAYSYADMLAEQPSREPVEDARRAHESLLAALDPSRPVAALDPFAAGLVAECRRALSGLPSYELVAPRATRCAERIVAFQSLSLGSNGELEQWVRDVPFEGAAGFQWWELAAAAGSSLPAYALIAASASARIDERTVAALDDAYFPAIGALHSLLDSLVDRQEDAVTGEFSLIARYATAQDVADGLERIAGSAVRQARALPAWRANTLLTVAMACSYLAEAPRQEPGKPRERALAALGPLALPSLAVFAMRRLIAGPRPAATSSPRPFDAEPQRADARAA